MDDPNSLFTGWIVGILTGFFIVMVSPLWDSEHANEKDLAAATTMCAQHGGVIDLYVNRRSPRYRGTGVVVICKDDSYFIQDRFK